MKRNENFNVYVKSFKNNGLKDFTQKETLAFLLNFSGIGENAEKTAELLLEDLGNIKNVFESDILRLSEISGMDMRSAIFLNLIYNIANYRRTEKSAQIKYISNSDDAGNFALYHLSSYKNEVLYTAVLDSRKHLIDVRKLADGALHYVDFDIRLFTAYISCFSKAKYALIMHNHPNGAMNPSYDDIVVTNKIASVLSSFGMEIYDHIIVAGSNFISMRERGLLK